jgi:hypothetical protein
MRLSCGMVGFLWQFLIPEYQPFQIQIAMSPGSEFPFFYSVCIGSILFSHIILLIQNVLQEELFYWKCSSRNLYCRCFLKATSEESVINWCTQDYFHIILLIQNVLQEELFYWKCSSRNLYCRCFLKATSEEFVIACRTEQQPSWWHLAYQPYLVTECVANFFCSFLSYSFSQTNGWQSSWLTTKLPVDPEKNTRVNAGTIKQSRMKTRLVSTFSWLLDMDLWNVSHSDIQMKDANTHDHHLCLEF